MTQWTIFAVVLLHYHPMTSFNAVLLSTPFPLRSISSRKWILLMSQTSLDRYRFLTRNRHSIAYQKAPRFFAEWRNMPVPSPRNMDWLRPTGQIPPLNRLYWKWNTSMDGCHWKTTLHASRSEGIKPYPDQLHRDWIESANRSWAQPKILVRRLNPWTVRVENEFSIVFERCWTTNTAEEQDSSQSTPWQHKTISELFHDRKYKVNRQWQEERDRRS